MTDVKVEQCDVDRAFDSLGLSEAYWLSEAQKHLKARRLSEDFARHRQAAEKATRERDAGIADRHRQARLDMQKIASERKAKGEARDYESMAIEALHIATAIRSQNDG